VFAPNSHYRVLVTPAGRGKGKKETTPEQSKTPAEHRAAMTWPLPHIHVLRDTGTSCPMGKKTKADIQD